MQPPKPPVEPRSEAIPGKCGCCKRCQSTEIFSSDPGGYEVFSRMYYGLEVEVILGVNLAHAGPPLEQGTRGRRKRVLQRIPELGGGNGSQKVMNDHSGVDGIGKICSRSLHCTPHLSARR